MRIPSVLFLSSMTLTIFLISNFAEAQLIPPKARATSPGGQTIDQAQREDAMGPKARVAVSRFEDKSAKGKLTGQIGDGMAEMLANALFATNRFIVLERQTLGDVLQEQDLGASGRVKQETAARIGEIEGADLLIRGTITEFEPGTSGAGGGLGGISRGLGVIGGVLGGIKSSHVAMVVKVIDAKTSRVLASEQVEGKATDVGGMAGMAGGGLAGAFGAYSKTPMEKAIRVAIEETVKLIVAKTPAEYYRASVTPQTLSPPTSTAVPTQTPTPVTTPATVPIPPSMATPAQTPLKSSGPESRIVYVRWPKASLREGPGTEFKSLLEVIKGTPLAVLEEKGQWLRVSLEDGREGWIGRATTSETP
jgi:curli biogenesis system outer membrane secretion channel CsgG